eukprot:7000832-Prymnesium_polylepis.1
MGDRARGSRWSEAASWPLPLAVLIGIGLNSSPTSAPPPAPVPPCSRTTAAVVSGSYPHHPPSRWRPLPRM